MDEKPVYKWAMRAAIAAHPCCDCYDAPSAEESARLITAEFDKTKLLETVAKDQDRRGPICADVMRALARATEVEDG